MFIFLLKRLTNISIHCHLWKDVELLFHARIGSHLIVLRCMSIT
jgi:hypothetical protein